MVKNVFRDRVKVISVISAAVLILILAAFAVFSKRQDNAVSVIGGADGPTAIFVAGSENLSKQERRTVQLQERLQQTLLGIDGVKSSLVTIGLDEGDSPFVSAGIELSPGGHLSEEEQQSIVALIKNSVENIAEENIFLNVA